jgi:HEAT repeat protein
MRKLLATVMIVCLFAEVSLGDVWQDLAKYQYGDGQAADEADKVLQQTPVAQHAAIEDSLIAVVAAKDATPDGKALACRMLQQIGTEKCIPSVAGLLTDDVLSHYARLVLERMANANADAAMRAALDSAPDQVKIGIAGSLGVRRDDKAVSKLAKLAGHGDPALAAAAIRALGRIGGSAAAQQLRTMKPGESLVPVHMCALVECAESLTGADAAGLYEVVLAGKTTQRIAALNGMLAVDEKKAVALMVDIIKGDDVQMGGSVLTLVADVPSERLTKAMAGLLAALPDEKKPALITALGARGDAAALAGIAACLTSNNEPVHNAALIAAGKLGNEGTVKLLLSMGGAATGVIPRMPGGGVNAALIQALEDNPLKVPAIKAMIARNYLAAVPKLFDLLNDGDAEVRKAAWNGLGSLAMDDDITRMAKAAFAIQDEGELSCAMAAVRKGCAYAGDKPKCFDVMIPYYDAATLASKATMIELASLVGSPSALELVKNALKSGNKELVGKAVRSLAAWCCENAADELLILAGSAPEEVERILTLRGYIRLAGEGPNLNEEQRAEMFRKAAELAKRVDEQKLIAGHLNKAPNAVALVIANTYLDDPAVMKDVEQSALDIAERLHGAKKGPDDLIKEVANKLIRDNSNVERAKALLN